MPFIRHAERRSSRAALYSRQASLTCSRNASAWVGVGYARYLNVRRTQDCSRSHCVSMGRLTPALVVWRTDAGDALIAFPAALACPSCSRSSAVRLGKSNTLSGPTACTRAVYSGTERLFQLSASRIEAF